MSVQGEKLKAIADAIREKEGSTAAIPAKDFPARILALETGGLPEGVRVIEAKANVSSRGTVSGGGLASDGMNVTVSASAKSGFRFANWTENGSSVSEDAAYAFSVAKDRTLTAVFSAKTSRLPSGYTEVEYIQSDRACGIDTGFQLDLRYHEMTLDIQPTDISRLAEEDYISMPAYRPSSVTFYCALWRNLSNQIYSRFLNNNSVSSGAVNGLERVLITFYFPAKRVQIGETSYAAYSTTPGFAFGNNLYLFSYGSSSTWGSVPARLYSARISSSGTLVCDFVPCKNPSGVPGVYDLVRKQFYTNSLTGVLTAGPEV